MSPPLSVRQQYQSLIASGAIEADPAQARAVQAFVGLDEALAKYKPPKKQGFLGRLFGGGDNGQPPPRGLYVHGEVGRGKTMLMDLFFDTSPVALKRRSHFHEFMADAHERINNFRQAIKRGDIPDADVIGLTAASICDEAWLLCFDEFHVTDIADAMILSRLFAKLFELGTVVVATSNVAPDDLYKGGLNRSLFVPFIGQIKTHMRVMRLDARTDYRLEKFAGMKVWLAPDDAEAAAAIDRAWSRITGGAVGKPRDIPIKGRLLRVPKSDHHVARFDFADLCQKPLGASDYLRLAHEYHTIMIDHVPVMQYADRNAAKRFIALIDTLYDNAVKLMASAAAEPAQLYRATEGFEAMEFNRTVSRLIEMGSESYLALPHGRSDSTATGSTTGLVET
jgi:cell division protein ZapE